MTETLPTPLAPLSPTEERSWAMLAHLSVLVNLFTGILGPLAALLIYLLFKDRSRYVAYHSFQSFINQLVWWVGGGAIIALVWVVTGVLSLVVIGIFLLPLACLLSLMPVISVVQGVWGAVKTANGEDFRYWWIGDWTRGVLEN